MNNDTYLTDLERAELCDSVIDGVSMVDVKMATDLIDGYLGRTYLPRAYTDRVKLNRGMRGKLKQAPVIRIEAIVAVFTTPFGRSRQELEGDMEEYIELDPERDGYFTFIGDMGLTSMIYQTKPSYLEVKYLSGFEEIPARLKSATAMLACNIRQAQSFAGAKQLTSLDFQVSMTDDSFFTSDIKLLLKGLDYDVSVF